MSRESRQGVSKSTNGCCPITGCLQFRKNGGVMVKDQQDGHSLEVEYPRDYLTLPMLKHGCHQGENGIGVDELASRVVRAVQRNEKDI